MSAAVRRRWTAALVVASAALPFAACSGRGGGAGGARGRNLVVVLLDALPAAGVGAWGYARDVTPNLDAFAAGGVRFDQAYASASYTLASVSSIFTGHGPAAHGVVSLDSNVLDDGHATLAEALAARGFATGGFSANPHITPEGGFGQGFDTFRHYGRERLDRHAVQRALEEDALDWWRDHAGAPRFLYVHVLPPHQPYDAPEPHRSLFGASEVPRELGMTDWLVEADDARRVERGSALARAIRSRYDAGLHHADAFLGRLLAELRADGAEDDTVFCVLSDHGEAFAEHGRLLHGTTVFEEMTRVPLVLDWPAAEPAVVDPLVATSDLAPTLCELLDVPWPGGGRSFLAALDGRLPEREVISRTVGNYPVWSLRTSEWSFLHQPKKNVRLLYDRRTDPGETTDLLTTVDGTWEQRSTGRTFTRKELVDLGRELTKRLNARLNDDRRLGRDFRRRADRTHRAAVEDLGYAEGDESD